MTYDNQAEPPARQPLLQPFDRRQVQMVGRLVQQQHVRAADHCPRQRRAPGLTARQLVGGSGPVQRQAVQQGLGHMGRMLLALGQAGGGVIQHGVVAGKVGFLRQIGDPDPQLNQPFARIRLDLAGQQLQQRRLARPIAPDQRDSFAPAYR